MNQMLYWRASLRTSNRIAPDWEVLEIELGYRAAFALLHHDAVMYGGIQ